MTETTVSLTRSNLLPNASRQRHSMAPVPPTETLPARHSFERLAAGEGQSRVLESPGCLKLMVLPPVVRMTALVVHSPGPCSGDSAQTSQNLMTLMVGAAQGPNPLIITFCPDTRKRNPGKLTFQLVSHVCTWWRCQICRYDLFRWYTGGPVLLIEI